MKALSLVVLTLFLALPTEGKCWEAVVDDVSGESGQIANPAKGDKVWGAWCHDFTFWQANRCKERTCKLSPEELRTRLTELGMTQHVYPSVNEVRQQQSPEQRQMTTYDATCRSHIKKLESFLVPWDVVIMAE